MYKLTILLVLLTSLSGCGNLTFVCNHRGGDREFHPVLGPRYGYSTCENTDKDREAETDKDREAETDST